MSGNHLILFIGFAIISYLTLTLVLKVNRIKQLEAHKRNLKKSLEEMDEQAKLIVRTDIELNKAQEDLDKKISGLYSLQKISRQISTTLEEESIFNKVDPGHLEELGFEKSCAFLWDEEEKKFKIQLKIGYPEDYLRNITSRVDLDKNLYLNLIGTAKTFSSISDSADTRIKNKINAIFAVKSFVISPILPKEGSKGFLFIGTENQDVTITEGDEELITILGNQIGQGLENARLFEKSWRAQQELEKKIIERTRALSAALEEVKSASKRKTEFISSVSHELRTPLTSIKGYAAIMLEEKLGKLPPAVKERLKRVNHHSNELANMVNDLLDIARIESGKAEMKMTPQNLSSILATAIDLVTLQCRNKNITLAQNLQKDIPVIIADRSQIERVFINLLGNAVKFTPEGGKIIVRAKLKGEEVQIEIQDTGIGIPPEALKKIFDEFYRVDNAVNQEVKGTGLGLSLVKHIIEAHQGKISVASNVGTGTTFSFTLPAK
ncbi:MAG: ATP-binding protein [Candidatus Omnitrophota bacterium]